MICYLTTFLAEMITFLVSAPVFRTLSGMGSEVDAQDNAVEQHPSTSSKSNDSHNSQPIKTSQSPVKMTDLLLQGSGAKSAKKHGGTGVDEFMKEIPIHKRQRTKRRRLCELPQKLKQTMGHANILWARGEVEKAKTLFMELIRQGKLI